MNSKKLKALAWQVLKIERRLRKESGIRDRAVEPLRARAEELQRAVYKLASERELEEAERADKGRVLWELFMPRESYFAGRYKRTPYRLFDNSYWTLGEVILVRQPGDAYKELDHHWHKEPFDPVKFQAHAAMVDQQWAKFRSNTAADLEAGIERAAA